MMPSQAHHMLMSWTGLAVDARQLPDGSIYYHAISIAAPLWRLPASGGQPVKIADGVVWFNLCLIDSGVYYIDRHEGETRLRFFDFVRGTATTVARNIGEIRAGLTATSDGRTVLFTRADTSVDDLMLVEDLR